MLSPRHFRLRNLSMLVAMVATAARVATAHAGLTRTWVQAGGGAWDTPGAWFPAGVPGGQDFAIIPAGLGTITVMLDINTPILNGWSLQNPAGTLDLNGHTLAASDTCTYVGTVLASGVSQALGGYLRSAIGFN